VLLASLSDVFIVGSNGFGPTVQGCWLPTPFASFPFTSPPVRRRVPSGSERAIAESTDFDGIGWAGIVVYDA